MISKTLGEKFAALKQRAAALNVEWQSLIQSACGYNSVGEIAQTDPDFDFEGLATFLGDDLARVERERATEMIKMPTASAAPHAEAPCSVTAGVVVNGARLLVSARAGAADAASIAGAVMAIVGAVELLAQMPSITALGMVRDGRDMVTWVKGAESATQQSHAQQPVAPPPTPTAEDGETAIHSLQIDETRTGKNITRTIGLYTREGGKYPDVRVSLADLVDEIIASMTAQGFDVDEFVGLRKPTPGLKIRVEQGKPKIKDGQPTGKHHLNYVRGSVLWKK